MTYDEYRQMLLGYGINPMDARYGQQAYDQFMAEQNRGGMGTVQDYSAIAGSPGAVMQGDQTPDNPSSGQVQGRTGSVEPPQRDPYGSMYSQGSGFTVGRNPMAGQNIAGAPTAMRMGIPDPKIIESWAKNAMIGDLFGGYQGWVDAGKPNLGNYWKAYTGIARQSFGNTSDMDFDRLRRQGDLRRLPSRDRMLEQMGIGGQPTAPPPGTDPPQKSPSPSSAGPLSSAFGQRGLSDPSAALGPPPTGFAKSAEMDPYESGSYQPWNPGWVQNNVYGTGGWQPPYQGGPSGPMWAPPGKGGQISNQNLSAYSQELQNPNSQYYMPNYQGAGGGKGGQLSSAGSASPGGKGGGKGGAKTGQTTQPVKRGGYV